MLAAGDDELDAGARDASGVERHLEAFVGRDEPEAQHDELVAEAEVAAGPRRSGVVGVSTPWGITVAPSSSLAKASSWTIVAAEARSRPAWTAAMPARAKSGGTPIRWSAVYERSIVEGATTWCSVVTRRAAPSRRDPETSAGTSPMSEGGPP